MPLSDDGAAVILKDGDNVAVALRPLEGGTPVCFGGTCILTLRAVAAGHTLALRQIGPGERIVTGGDAIGLATSSIAPGDHVHAHNVEGARRCDDLKEAG